jgi:hypothetical protein
MYVSKGVVKRLGDVFAFRGFTRFWRSEGAEETVPLLKQDSLLGRTRWDCVGRLMLRHPESGCQMSSGRRLRVVAAVHIYGAFRIWRGQGIKRPYIGARSTHGRWFDQHIHQARDGFRSESPNISVLKVWLAGSARKFLDGCRSSSRCFVSRKRFGDQCGVHDGTGRACFSSASALGIRGSNASERVARLGISAAAVN